MIRRLIVAACALLPAAADMLPLTPEQCAALGQEPYATFAEAGLPLPPTREQMRALPPLVFARQQAAVKETLLLRWALIRQAGHRSNAEVETASAGLARAAEAPELLAEIFQHFADGDLSRVEEHEWTNLLKELLSAYRTDELAVRLLVEDADLTPEDALALASFLPLADAFNTIPLRPPSDACVLADLQLLQREYRALAELYAAVQDTESAEQAAVQALPIVQRLLTTGPTLFHLRQPQTLLNPAQNAAMKAANEAYTELNTQRARLQETQFFSALRLRALDLLAE